MVYYFFENPQSWGINSETKTKIGNHHFQSSFNNHSIVWPDKLNAESINPEEIEKVIECLKPKDWLFVDSLIGEVDLKCIINHINKSGVNFLRKRTPYKNGVMFLDVSNIYSEIDGLDNVKVSTVGRERFYEAKASKEEIWSLGIGLVSPVFHYLGIKITAVGAKPNKDNGRKLFNIAIS